MQRTLLFITIVSIAFASFVGGLHAQTRWFRDVPNDHWAKDAIDFVVEQEIMKGMNAETFAPDEAMTRAQFATVMYRIFEGNGPTKTLGDARDAQRRSDVNTILNAIYQYAIDNNGELPGDIPRGIELEICRFDADDCTGDMVDLSPLEGSYLVHVPSDPQMEPGSDSTGYTVSQDQNGRITISAPNAETGDVSVTR